MTFCKNIFLFVLLLSFGNSYSQTWSIDSLQKIIDEGKNDVDNARALNIIATEYSRTDMGKTKNYLYRAIHLGLQLNNEVQLAQSYALMVSIQMNTGKKDSAQYYLQLMKELAAGSVSGITKASFNQAAGLFYKKLGNYKEALPYMIKSLDDYAAGSKDKIYTTLALKTSVAGQCLNIGNTYMEMGDFKKALQYHLKGLKNFEELDNKRGISFCEMGISTDFLRLGQYKEAIPFLAKSIELKKELNDKRGIATALQEYGAVYKGLANYDKAVSYLNNALQSFHDMKLIPDEANADVELGKIYVLIKDTALASQYFKTAKNLALQLKDSSLLIAVDAEMAAMQNSIVSQKKAEQKLMASLQNSIAMEDKGKELSAYQYLTDYYTSNKEFDKALEYTNRLHQVNDSVQNKEVQLAIKKMEEQYNVEKKEKEIALLKKDQELNRVSLQRQRSFQYGAIIFLVLLLLIGFLVINRYRVVQRAKRLIDMERMRNNIARDLHDDIGSTLTSINILSKVALQQQANGNTMMEANMQKIKDRSSAIMESMGDIVWAINPQNDTIEQMIFRMKEFTAEILEPLNINYTFKEEGDFSTIKLNIKNRKDFYLLFKEAVNNAAKYSHCKNLNIQVGQEQQFLHLKVVDDGTGFNDQIVKNGNGLINMRERANSMAAKINIATAPGKGTSIVLDVPIT